MSVYVQCIDMCSSLLKQMFCSDPRNFRIRINYVYHDVAFYLTTTITYINKVSTFILKILLVDAYKGEH